MALVLVLVLVLALMLTVVVVVVMFAVVAVVVAVAVLMVEVAVVPGAARSLQSLRFFPCGLFIGGFPYTNSFNHSNGCTHS